MLNFKLVKKYFELQNICYIMQYNIIKYVYKVLNQLEFI